MTKKKKKVKKKKKRIDENIERTYTYVRVTSLYINYAGEEYIYIYKYIYTGYACVEIDNRECNRECSLCFVSDLTYLLFFLS